MLHRLPFALLALSLSAAAQHRGDATRRDAGGSRPFSERYLLQASVAVDYFGPLGQCLGGSCWFKEITQTEFFDSAEGRTLSGSEMRLVNETTKTPSAGVRTPTMSLQTLVSELTRQRFDP